MTGGLHGIRRGTWRAAWPGTWRGTRWGPGGRMTVVGPFDAFFLIGETRVQPTHVGGLMLFDLPDDAGPEYVADLYRGVVEGPRVHPMFGRRVRHRLEDLGYWSWEQDDAIDADHHVRYHRLPEPGRIRELFELTSELHGNHLDRQRALWELHVIEGLQGRRFAMYHKVHHALVDGVTALRWMQAAQTEDPDRVGMPSTFALSDGPGTRSGARAGLSRRDRAAAAGRAAVDLAKLPAVGVRSAVEAWQAAHSAVPFGAPRSILNGPISAERRFAAQSWPMERLESVRTGTGATLNDVMLGMCAGALRRYLLELGALPDKALTAMVPVSLRSEGDGDGPGRGNSLATLLCDLATDESDVDRRFARILDSMNRGKTLLSQLSPVQNLMLGALGIGSAGLVAIAPGVPGRLPPPYNLVISNIPGPVDSTLYWNRARLVGLYPASIALNGQALNISVTSYRGNLHFGLVGCRRTVPHLQRLLGHLETSLVELEQL